MHPHHYATEEEIPFSKDTQVKGFTGFNFSIGQRWDWTIDPVHPLNVRMGVNQISEELFRQSLNGHKPSWDTEHYYYDKMTIELPKLIALFNSSECCNYELITNCNVLVIMKILDRLNEIDVPAIVSHIQSFQGSSGGFNDSSLNFYPTLRATMWSVVALIAVGAEPLNISGVRDFVYSMQTTNSIFPIDMYEFRNVDTEGIHYSSTCYASVILDILGYPIPHLSELLAKVVGEFSDFLANHSSYSTTDFASKLELLTTRTLMFPVRGPEMREELLPLALSFHDSLHRLNPALDISKDRDTDGLLVSLILMGRADPHLDFYLSPKEVLKTTKEINLSLSINNTAYFAYQFNISSVELVGEVTNHYQLDNLSQDNLLLLPTEITSFPLKLNKTSNDTVLPFDTIKLKLTGSAPVFNLFFEQGHPYNFSFEIFFEIPLTDPAPPSSNDNKAKIIAGAILGSLAVVGGVAGGTALVRRKRKQKPETD